HHELAVLRHHVTDPDNGENIPCRLIFVFSSADQKICQQKRERTVAKIRTGLQRLTELVACGNRHYTDPVKVYQRAAKLVGDRDAARYFPWELVPLPAAGQAALPPPQRGCRRPTHRFAFHYDEQAAQADTAYDGYSALLTTAPITQSADTLFTQFKQQCYV